MENVEIFKGIIVPFVNFAVFLMMAVYFMKKPLNAMAEKRTREFTKAAEEAAQAKKAAEDKLDQLNARLQNLDLELKSMRDQAISDANAESVRIIDAAKGMAKSILDEAERVTNFERSKAVQELRKELLSLALKSAEGKIASQLDDGRRLELVRQAATDIRTRDAAVGERM